jgi:serine peptidase DegS
MYKSKAKPKRVIIITMTILILALLAFLLYRHIQQPKNIDLLYNSDMATNSYSFAPAVQKSAPAVVSIQTTNASNNQKGLGSGVIIDNAGHILTNNHVIESAQQITVKLSDGRSSTANVIGIDPQTDLAVLKINLTDLPVIPIGNSTRLQVGDVVLAIGNPYGLSNTVTQGIISALGSIQEISNAPQEFGELLENLIQTDAAINLGNSGGALVDARGHIIGISTAIVSSITGSQGIGFAIPIDTAKEIMTELIAKGSITRAWLGAQLSEIPTETRQHLRYQDQNGIYIQDTIRNSPAQKAGILPGDILTKVNNVETKDILNTLRLISMLTPDNTYDLEIFRSGEKLVYPVEVIERPLNL